MKIILLYIILLLPTLAFSQFHIGDSTKLSIGPNTAFFTGGNATFNGPLTNGGTIVSYRDVNFVKNTHVGNLKFVGDIDQNLSGDTINVGDFELNKTGNLILLTDQVRAVGTMNVTNGVVQSDDELDLIHAGTVDETGAGFVEGKMIGRLSNAATFTFPMGISDGSGRGFKNYLTLTANKPGTFIRVTCRGADPTQLFPDSLINGITDEVEWLVSVVGTDSVEASFEIDYSGLDFGLPERIKADHYEPAVAMFYREDTLYHALNTVGFTSDIPDPDGLVESNQRVWITNVPRRLSIASMPFADGDVLYIPNVFAPNAANPDNRIFRPFYAGSQVTSLSITITDSFNQVVYETPTNLTAPIDVSEYGWNGVLPSGLDAPGGVYYYTINLNTDGDLEPGPWKGSILLMR